MLFGGLGATVKWAVGRITLSMDTASAAMLKFVEERAVLSTQLHGVSDWAERHQLTPPIGTQLIDMHPPAGASPRCGRRLAVSPSPSSGLRRARRLATTTADLVPRHPAARRTTTKMLAVIIGMLTNPVHAAAGTGLAVGQLGFHRADPVG